MNDDTMNEWVTNHGDTVELYQSSDGIRWRVRARNGEIIATGSEAYERYRDAFDSAIRHHPAVEL